MGGGFDDMDDSSPFLAEPAYDPRYGGWLTNEMRARLKILQTGTDDQVDIQKHAGEDASMSDCGTTAEAPIPGPWGQMLIDWMEDGAAEDVTPMTVSGDVLKAKVATSEAAVQCALLGESLQHDTHEWSEDSESGGQHYDAPENRGPHLWGWGGLASSSGPTEPDAPLADGDEPLGIAHSSHLVRLSRPIVWAQRKWLPLPEK